MAIRHGIKRPYEYGDIIEATNDTILKHVNEAINQKGPNADLRHIDVSAVTDMSYLFMDTDFNGNISNWDVSNVENMTSMFQRSTFDGDLSKWNVSKVKEYDQCFDCSPLEKQPDKQPKFTS